MYELFILAQLMRRPVHGYLIAKIINDIIGPYARISNGRLYPLLSKLAQSGLIEPVAQDSYGTQGDRQLRTYRITEAGKQRFYEIMMDTALSPGDYQKIFWQKSGFLDLLKPLERLHLIEHYINYCQTHIHHSTVEAEDIVHRYPTWGPEWKVEHIELILGALQHMIKQWELELDWANALRAKELAKLQIENGPERSFEFVEHPEERLE